MRLRLKQEDMQRADYFVDAGVCEQDKHLEDIIDTIKPTTVPLHKRAQRNVVLGWVDVVLTVLPATDAANVYELDDWLGVESAGKPETGTLFAKDMWDRYGNTVHAHRIRIFTPNLKAAVIEGL